MSAVFRKAVSPVGVPTARLKLQARLAALAERVLDGLVLRAHGLAVRLDRVPEGFGDDAPVNEADAGAVRREWLRLLRQWADYSPEEVFALKAGALMLGAVLVGLLIMVAVI
jgi:hypothetical protein